MPSSDVSEDDDMAVTGEPSEEDDDMAVTGEPSDNVSDYEIDEEDVEARDGEEEEEEEVEEDEEEEEEEEEEPEEEPEEEEGEDEEQINADSSGSPKAADEGREDVSQDAESEDHDEDLRSGSYAPEKSEASPPLDSCDVEDNNGNDANIGDSIQGIKSKHFKDDGFQESPLDNKHIGASPEKKASIDVQKGQGGVCSDNEANICNSDSVNANNSKPSEVDKKVAVDFLTRDGSSDRAEVILNSEKETKEIDMRSGEELKQMASSLPASQLRVRSISPGAEVEDRNKRQAVVCDFFTRGWCIKGSSCRFLHPKDGVNNSSQSTKDEMVVESWKDKVQLDAGLKQGTETSRLASFTEPLTSSIVSNPSVKSHFPSEKVLPWEHREGQTWHHFHEERKLTSSHFLDNKHGLSGVQFNFPKLDTPSGSCPANPSEFHLMSSSYEEHIPPFGTASCYEDLKHHSDIGDKKCSVSEEFLIGNPLAGKSLFPEYRYGSVISPSSYGSSRYPSSHVKSVDEVGSLKNRGQFMLTDHASPAFSSSPNLNSSFPCPPTLSSHKFGWLESSLPHSSSYATIGSLGSQTLLDLDRGHLAPRSTSLPRSSASPFYSRSESENLPPSSTSVDPLLPAGHKTQSCSNDWEPSVPFRPSFYFTPPSVSSPGSQYDPLIDSIELPNGGDRSSLVSSFSRGAIGQSTSSQQTNEDPGLGGIHDQGYDADKHLLYFNQHSDASVLHRNTHAKETSFHHSDVDPVATFGNDRQNRSLVPNEEISLGDDNIIDATKANEADLDRSTRHQIDVRKYKKEYKADRGKHKNEMDHEHNSKLQTDGALHSKESKSLKIFRAALVDFVKELIKPSWRDGHLSKDAHKTIVKKAVDKVLSTLHPHQIPSTLDLTKQYLYSSRPKIAKLVEGYVDKYVKS